MFTLPICLATLPPSRPPSASPTAPVAFADSEPVTFNVPVSGVASDSTSCAPVAAIGPREAVQPISAFCRICDIGLSALPSKIAARRDRRRRGSPTAHRDRRHHGGCARSRRQRRQFGKRAAAGRGARRDEVHDLQAGHKRDDDDRERNQNRLRMHRQTHRPPGFQINRPEGFYRAGEGDATAHCRELRSIQNGPGECRGRFLIKKR